RMNVAGDLARLQPTQKPGGQIEIGLIDERAVGLEGVGSVGDAVEEGARADFVEQVIQVAVHQQVYGADVLFRQAVQSPGGQVRRRPDHVFAAGEQHPQQVRADEATAGENE